MANRLEPVLRKEQIIDAALQEATRTGYMNMTRDGVATAAGCAPRLVSYYFGTMPTFRRTVMRAAITFEVLPVIAQGLIMKDRHALKAPPELKAAALAEIATR